MRKEAFSQFLQRAKRGQLLHVRSLSNNYDTEIYLLHTQKENYICTLYLESKPLSFFSHLQQVTQHICRLGFPTSQFLYCDVIDDKQAILWSQLPGRVKTNWSLDEYYQAGLTVGTLHKLCRDFTPSQWTSPLLAENQLQWHEIRQSVPEAFHFIEHELKEINHLWPCHLPYGLIHGDLWYTQFRFGKKGIQGLLDFSLSRKDLFIYDLSSLIKGIYYTHTVMHKEEKYHALLDGYQSVRLLSSEELHSVDLMIRCRLLHTMICLLRASVRVPDPSLSEEYLNLATLNIIKYQESIKHPILTP